MSRIKSLDLARGFVVFMMAPVHTMLMFSRLEIRDLLLGKSFAFIAEWHGAQIFMLIIGITFVYSKNQPTRSIFLKAGILLVIAYGLNVFKFIIPHFFGWLPQSLLSDLQIDPGWRGYLQLFLLGDILHFASISLIVLFSIFKCGFSEKAMLWFAIGISLIAPFFWDASSNHSFINYTLELLGGQPPCVFFPLLPWLVYPLLGFYIGRILQKNENQKTQPRIGFDSFWIIGISLIAVTAILKYWLNNSEISSFYRTRPLDTILHVGFVLITLSAWHWISRNVKPNYFFKMFTYASRHITQIYVIQWILICWLLPLIGYQQTGFMGTILLIFLTSIGTFITSLFIDLVKSKKIN